MTQTRRMAPSGIAIFTALLLQACGSSSSTSSASVRLINATNIQASLDLLSSVSDATSAVLRDSASSCVSIAEGSASLQVNSAGSSTARVSTSTPLTKDVSYSFIAYEVSGTAKLATLTENSSTPTTGTAQWRVLNLGVWAAEGKTPTSFPGAAALN